MATVVGNGAVVDNYGQRSADGGGRGWGWMGMAAKNGAVVDDSGWGLADDGGQARVWMAMAARGWGRQQGDGDGSQE